MGDKKSAVEEVKEFIVKFISGKLMKGASKITDDQEAAAALAHVGELQIRVIRAKADLAEDVKQLQEKSGADLAPVQEELAKELTRLRDYGMAKGLLDEAAESQTLTLPTGRISFYHTPQRVSVGKETEVVEALQKLPKGHALRQLLVPQPPPPPKLNRQKLLVDSGLLKDLVELLGKPAKIMKSLCFAAFSTAQPQLREGMKITATVKEITVKEIPVE